MTSQHLTDDLCLDYLHGELPAAERSSIESHVDECSHCRQLIDEYGTILRNAASAMAGEELDRLMSGSIPWSIEDGEKRLYAAIEAEERSARVFGRVKEQMQPVPPNTPVMRLANLLSRVSLRTDFAIATSLVLAITIGVSMYIIGLKRGLDKSQATKQSESDGSVLRLQLERLADERAKLETVLREREASISGLRAQLKEQREQMEALEAGLQSANLQTEEQTEKTRQVSSERDELAHKFDDQQAVLAAAQRKLDALQQVGATDALRVVSLENQIQQIAKVSNEREGTIDEQRRMLAADRDIRDLMGARDLYIAEVYDVGGNGKRKKPYGRVFYTKGKSLIFYAYDLDQQPGLKNASTFQAWGLRGPDRSTALNLGVLYVDNSSNKRWVLRFDDSKALEEINAVFVTVEPNGESQVPRGQQVLFAYLREEPNHP